MSSPSGMSTFSVAADVMTIALEYLEGRLVPLAAESASNPSRSPSLTSSSEGSRPLFRFLDDLWAGEKEEEEEEGGSESDK